MPRHTDSYVHRIVAGFGSIAAASRASGIAYSTIKSWQDRASMPDHYKPAMLAAAQREGLLITKADFFPLDA